MANRSGTGNSQLEFPFANAKFPSDVDRFLFPSDYGKTMQHTTIGIVHVGRRCMVFKFIWLFSVFFDFQVVDVFMHAKNYSICRHTMLKRVDLNKQLPNRLHVHQRLAESTRPLA